MIGVSDNHKAANLLIQTSRGSQELGGLEQEPPSIENDEE
jgi:hypothetical protein